MKAGRAALAAAAVLCLAAGAAGVAEASPPSKKHGKPRALPPRDRSLPMQPGDLRDDPTRQEILAAMERVKPHAQDCFDRFQVAATVTVKLVVSGASGHVASAAAQGELADSPTAKCVEDAARAAQFRPFRRDSVTLTYPFVLKGDAPGGE